MGRKFGKETTEQGYVSINDHTASGVRQPNSVSPTVSLRNGFYYDSCVPHEEQTPRGFLELLQYRSKWKRKDSL